MSIAKLVDGLIRFTRRLACNHDWERLCDIRKDSAIGEHGYELPRNEDGEVLYVDGSWWRCRKCGKYLLTLAVGEEVIA